MTCVACVFSRKQLVADLNMGISLSNNLKIKLPTMVSQNLQKFVHFEKINQSNKQSE